MWDAVATPWTGALVVAAFAYGLSDRYFWAASGAPIGRWDLIVDAAAYPGFLLFVTVPAWSVFVWRRTGTLGRHQTILRIGHWRGSLRLTVLDGVRVFLVACLVIVACWSASSIGLPAEAHAPTGSTAAFLFQRAITPLAGLGIIVLGHASLFGSVLATVASVAILGGHSAVRAVVLGGFWLLTAASVGGIVPPTSVGSIANFVDPVTILDSPHGALIPVGTLGATVLFGWIVARARDRAGRAAVTGG